MPRHTPIHRHRFDCIWLLQRVHKPRKTNQQHQASLILLALLACPPTSARLHLACPRLPPGHPPSKSILRASGSPPLATTTLYSCMPNIPGTTRNHATPGTHAGIHSNTQPHTWRQPAIPASQATHPPPQSKRHQGATLQTLHTHPLVCAALQEHLVRHRAPHLHPRLRPTCTSHLHTHTSNLHRHHGTCAFLEKARVSRAQLHTHPLGGKKQGLHVSRQRVQILHPRLCPTCTSHLHTHTMQPWHIPTPRRRAETMRNACGPASTSIHITGNPPDPTTRYAG